MAAQTYDPRFGSTELTPEDTVRIIRRERAQKSVLAAVLALLAVLATVFAVYMVYRDVPAPESPANAKTRILEPYR